jgi:hypothetical protein
MRLLEIRLDTREECSIARQGGGNTQQTKRRLRLPIAADQSVAAGALGVHVPRLHLLGPAFAHGGHLVALAERAAKAIDIPLRGRHFHLSLTAPFRVSRLV